MDVGIVGGGVGGLTAALLLRRQGADVTIYERSTRLGGRLAFEEGGGYRIDQGPTIVLLPELLLSILEEAGIPRDCIPLRACDPLYRIHYADGAVLHKYSDTAKQLEELGRIFPDEREGFERYLRDMKVQYAASKEAFLDRPFLRKRDFYKLRNIRLLARMKAYQSVRELAVRYFKDSRLVDAFSLQTLYVGGAPFQTPSLYSLIPYAEHAFGIWYVEGGYASLIPILEEALARSGVTIKRGCEVEKLVIEQGSCKGVQVEGKTVKHRHVIYNGDFPHISGLLPDRKIAGRKTYRPSSGCLLIYLGLDRQWEEAAVHQFFLPDSLGESLEAIFLKDRIPEKPSFYCFYPSAIDPSAAPAGHSVMYMLVPVPTSPGRSWEEAGPKLAEHVLAEAEKRGFPGLRAAVRWMKVRTPDDARQDGLYEGGSFGIAPSLTQSAIFRPQIVPYPIDNLYAAGASVHPGGGVPIVMQGAKLLAEHLTKEMQR
ncbi:phytoene desaturase [Paenibacillus phyllosphaerae]|uniref:Phytoene desaturase n=1 Tax=Paenibacillus phyllosphaerae TaxID=274593 RepID=A0A7W5B2V8_9BACL|nr:phytoene desaturase family protein [Paenibacillus phyllosphaerae]MBB3112891.1 phytoene desaturase [Paenibacillus phyllosphaerae]